MENLDQFNIHKGPPRQPVSSDKSKDTVPEELVLIAQRVGGDFGMKIEMGKPGSGSYFDTEKVCITLDPLQIEKDPTLARFVVAHEGGHRAISVSPRELGLQQNKINELFGQIGFGFVQNSIEDPADNDWVKERFPGLETEVKTVYDDQFERENVVLSTPEITKIQQGLGYWPKFAIYGSEVIRHWHQGRYSESLDNEVESVLDSTQADVTKSIRAIPATDSLVRGDVLEKARFRFKNNTERIWPKVKTLIEQDVRDMENRSVAQDLKSVKEKLEQKKKELEQAEAAQNQDQIDELKEEIEKLEKSIEQFGISEELLKELLDKIQQALDEMSQSPQTDGEEGTPVPMDKLSEKLRRALREAFDKLPKGQQDEIRQKSLEELKKIEDALNKSLRGQLNKDQTPSHEELDKQEKTEEKEADSKKKNITGVQRQSLRDTVINREWESQISKVREGLLTEYEKQRKEVSGLIDFLFMRLKRILKPEDYGGEDSGYSSGQIVDMGRAMQGEHDIDQKSKMWIREQEPGHKDYRFWHLVDLSGSMSGQPIRETFKGFIVVSEAVDRVEDYNTEDVAIHQGITGFNEKVFEYKSYRDRFTRSLEEKLGGMVSQPEGEGSGGTSTDLGTKAALTHLMEGLGESGNFLLTYTDGQPNRGSQEPLRQMILSTKEERAKKKIRLGLVWVGSISDEKEAEKELAQMVKHYGYDFGIMMPATGADQSFASKLADLIENIIENPDQY